MASKTDDQAIEGLVVLEAAPGRAPAGARDGADAMLRPEDRFTDIERARPARRWLRQGALNRPDRIQATRQRTEARAVELASTRASYAVPAEMRDFAQESVDLARKAFDSFIGAARRTADTAQGSTEAARIDPLYPYSLGFEYAEQNVNAAFDLARKLVRSKDMQEAMQHQADFVRSQFAAIQAQAKEFSDLAQSAMQQGAESAKLPSQRGIDETGHSGVENRQDAEREPGNAGRST